MHTKQQLSEMKNEHDTWQDRLRFYKDEISHFNQHLGKLAIAGGKQDRMASVEHFQNQFIIQKEQLDILNHGVNEHEQFLARFAEAHPVAIDHQLFANHNSMLDKIDTYKKLYTALKNEFNRFLSATL